MEALKEGARAVNVRLPKDEADIVIETAASVGITITMVLRMLIREHLLNDPIKFSVTK